MRSALTHERIAEAVAVGGNEAGGRVRKVNRQNICARVGDLTQEAAARPRGLRRVGVEDGRPIRLAALQRMVHQIASHDRVLALRADHHAAVARRMPRRRDKREIVVKLKGVVDHERLSRLDDRPAIVAP